MNKTQIITHIGDYFAEAKFVVHQMTKRQYNHHCDTIDHCSFHYSLFNNLEMRTGDLNVYIQNSNSQKRFSF